MEYQKVPVLRYVFLLILVSSLYHFVRDILQIIDLHSVFSNFLHRPHLWCAPYCNFVTLPLDIIGVIGAIVILRRKNVGVLGLVIIFLQILWIPAFFLP